MAIEIRQLRYVIETARQGSVSAAARQMGLTEQALSKSIRGLESALG